MPDGTTKHMNTIYDLHFTAKQVLALTERGRAFLGATAVDWHPPLAASAIDAGLRISFETSELRARCTNA